MSGNKIMAGFLILAVSVLVFAPRPAHAGGLVGLIIGMAISKIVGSLVASIVVGTLVSLMITTVFTQLTGTMSVLTAGTCSGSYDPLLGTCSVSSVGIQHIYTPKDVKFTGMTFGPPPTADEFAKNFGVKENVSTTWSADAPHGINEFVSFYDPITKKAYRFSGGVACKKESDSISTSSLPYGRNYKGQVRYETCAQITGSSAVLTCSGCGCFDYRGIPGTCGILVQADVRTADLPPVAVDLKANGQDGGLVFKPGVPVTLSWTSQYATECEAGGSWSGVKPASGTERVVPSRKDDIYKITCRRVESRDFAKYEAVTLPFKNQPLTTTVFDVSSNPKAVAIDEVLIDYNWCHGGVAYYPLQSRCTTGEKTFAPDKIKTGAVFEVKSYNPYGSPYGSLGYGSSGLLGKDKAGCSKYGDSYCLGIQNSELDSSGKKLSLTWEGIIAAQPSPYGPYGNGQAGYGGAASLGANSWLSKFLVIPKLVDSTAEDSVSGIYSLPGLKIGTMTGGAGGSGGGNNESIKKPRYKEGNPLESSSSTR